MHQKKYDQELEKAKMHQKILEKHEVMEKKRQAEMKAQRLKERQAVQFSACLYGH